MNSRIKNALISCLTLTLINPISTVFSFNKEMMNSISETLNQVIPPEMEKDLELKFTSFSLNSKSQTFLLANSVLSSDIVKEFFKKKTYQGKPFTYISVRMDDEKMTVSNLKMLLEQNNDPKLVLISNIWCKDAQKYVEIVNLLRESENTFVYIEKPKTCLDEKCKDCIQLLDFNNREYDEGRLDKIIFEKVEKDFYEELLNNLIEKCNKLKEKGELDTSINLSNDDIEAISYYFGINTLAQSKEFIKNAFINASIRKSSVVELVDFVKLFNDDIAKTNSIKPFNVDQFSSAIHECGHAIVAHVEGRKVSWLNIQTNSNGLTVHLCSIPSRFNTYKDLLSMIRIAMAGNIAQKLFTKEGVAEGSDSDFVKVKLLLEKAVIINDRSLEYSEEEKKNAIIKLFNKLYDETTEILQKYANSVTRTADRLTKEGSVNNMKLMRREEFLKGLDEIDEEIKVEEESKKRFVNLLKDYPELLSKADLSKEFFDNMEAYVKNKFGGKTLKNK